MAQLNVSTTAPHIEIKSTNVSTDAGVGVFATGTLSPGDAVIAVQQPLLVALDADRLGDTCYNCYRREGDVCVETTLGFRLCPFVRRDVDEAEVQLSRCAGCKTVRYCSKVCQRSSWTAHHALECPIFEALHPRDVPNHIRAVLRILLLRKAGRVKADDWTLFMACSAHAEGHSRGDKREELANLKHMMQMIMLWFPFEVEEDLVLGILMRLKVNGLNLQTPFHDPIGLAMHPLLAKANHSCNPNCYVRFLSAHPLPQGRLAASPGSIVLTPLRKITVGEEITISYIDENMPARFRKQELSDRYFFTCNCVKCTGEEEGEAKLGSLAKSKLYRMQDQAKTILDITEKSSPSSSEEDIAKGFVSQLTTFLESDPTRSLTQYPFPQLLHQLILSHIDAQNFSAAFRLTALLHFRIDKIRYPLHASGECVHPFLFTHTLLLIKLTGAILDTLTSTATSVDPAAKQLSEEVDLEHWIQELVRSLILNVERTWKEQPWPWMRDIVKRHELSAPDGHSPHHTAIMKREQDRMRALCDRTLQALRSG